jgi:hypothetical protein
MTAVALVSCQRRPISPRCVVPINITICIEDKLRPFVLHLFALRVCLLCAPFSLFLICAGKPGYCQTPRVMKT